MARKTAARCRETEHGVAEISLSLDEGGRLSSAGQGAARARRVARWTVARSVGDGWVARATQRGEEAVDGRGVRHEHRASPPSASRGFETTRGVLTVKGNGNKERVSYVTNGARSALNSWLMHRGDAPGPLFVSVTKAARSPCGG